MRTRRQRLADWFWYKALDVLVVVAIAAMFLALMAVVYTSGEVSSFE